MNRPHTPLSSRVHLIAVTGGPCAGKSTFMAEAKKYLEANGIRTFILDEVATRFINAGFSPFSMDWPSEMEHGFQMHTLQHQLECENRYLAMAKDYVPEGGIVVLTDRGTVDGLAYAGRFHFDRILRDLNLRLHDVRERYTLVIHLVTAADGARKDYTLLNNAARSESPERACELDELTQNAWAGKKNFFVIDNSTSFERKVERALQVLRRGLDMPEPLEKEKKFLFLNFKDDFIPTVGVTAIEIEQHYLVEKREGDERRIRKWESKDGVSYFYTEKELTSTPGVRVERERAISKKEYDNYLGEKDRSYQPIRKRRHCFTYKNRHLELDVYRPPFENLRVVEVEMGDISEHVEFPSQWELLEVTGEQKYSNREIARGSLLSVA